MLHTASDRSTAAALTAVVLLIAGDAAIASGQVAAEAVDQAAAGLVVSSEVSETVAELRLVLADGRTLELALYDGRILLDDDDVGDYDSGDALDRSWRALLDAVGQASAGELPALLVGWQAPDGGGAGDRLDAALESALGAGVPAATAVAVQQAAPAPQPAPAPPAPLSDSMAELRDRIAELESMLSGADEADEFVRIDRREIEQEIRRELEREFGEARWMDRWTSPFRHVGRGIAGIFSTLALYAVLVGLGFAAVFFGHQYLEGVADTARQATLRSWLVGLAASFLSLPVFVLGIIALAISILGIPLLLVWVPLFPVAVVVAAIGGYLAVAHGAGEALAERRFHGGDWFKRANSYYYILTGVGLLLALFIASYVVGMAGPWLGFIQGLLKFLAVVLTWAAFTIGLGAMLISRGGTRPVAGPAGGESESARTFEEESHV